MRLMTPRRKTILATILAVVSVGAYIALSVRFSWIDDLGELIGLLITLGTFVNFLKKLSSGGRQRQSDSPELSGPYPNQA
jgi:hypothetical protein